jgi:hypothetical protein
MMDGLPGAELVEKGLRDLARGEESAEAMLLSMASVRLQGAGIELPTVVRHPEQRLYLLLVGLHGAGAHSQYNALRRRLQSFMRAAECVR